MPDEQHVDAVLATFNKHTAYHARQRGLLRHQWPSLYKALRDLDNRPTPDVALVASEQHLTSATAGIATVAASIGTVKHELRWIRAQPCPDCRDGKHRSCAGFAFDHKDREVLCPCEQADHALVPE